MEAESFSFPSKLHSSLENPLYRHCVEWDSTGRFIVFTDIREYERVVLPRYHKTRTFKSLVRQLHLYGFRRGTDARKIRDSSLLNYCSFYHPLFIRGRTDLLPLIKRKPKSTKAKEAAAKKRQEVPRIQVNYASETAPTHNSSVAHHHASFHTAYSMAPTSQVATSPSSEVSTDYSSHDMSAWSTGMVMNHSNPSSSAYSTPGYDYTMYSSPAKTDMTPSPSTAHSSPSPQLYGQTPQLPVSSMYPSVDQPLPSSGAAVYNSSIPYEMNTYYSTLSQTSPNGMYSQGNLVPYMYYPDNQSQYLGNKTASYLC
ncbi:hypothetical protein IWQ62_004645 [Dispira parvispora]|uniref:HSF-type DNA-binding domain-containing protein n=1 Tax=Dispira parvispora TaxID=1520584 RepID=A0A9W8E5Y9_9FUNG|nr:hypothetical protein IWQ62_004645 [Dispira parvispora]